MAIKKFFITFTIIIFVFLIGAGITMIQVINSAEARALEQVKASNENKESTGSIPVEENDGVFSAFIDVDPYNTLVMVKDKVGANTDSIILVNVNPAMQKISLLSIPRDTIVSTDLNHDNKSNDIMNMVYVNHGLDIEKTIAYVGKELGCEIKYGVVMNLKAIREIIDQLGGVDFEVLSLMDYDDPYQDLHIYFEAGMHHFNGEDSEKLLRFRKSNPNSPSTYWTGSDTERMKRLQDFIRAIIEQKANVLHGLKINSIVSLIFDTLNTNVTAGKIPDLIPDVLKADLNNIAFFTLKTHDDANFIHLIPEKEENSKILEENFKSKN